MTPFAAAIADTPQIEKPVATRSDRSSEIAKPPTEPTRAEERDRHDRDDHEERAKAERENVREHEIDPQQDDAELEQRPSGDGQAGSGRVRHPREVRNRYPERDAEDERRQARDGLVGAKRNGHSGSRESETGRRAHHSSGWRNG